jgi:stage II sporulation protein P
MTNTKEPNMRRHSETGIISFLRRAAKLAVISVVLAAFILAFSSDELFYKFLLSETMPYLYASESTPVFFELNNEPEHESVTTIDEPLGIESDVMLEDDTLLDDSEQITENPLAQRDDIIGIGEVIFQDEEEFGAFPDISYKENLTAENIDSLTDIDFFLSGFYNKDANTGIIKDTFNPEAFFNMNLSEVKDISQPQVLIFHTHGGSEYFIDSDTSDINEGIIGAGEELKYMLEQKYGIRAIHHSAIYDMVDGKSYRDGSYERMEPDIQKLLDDNPSIKVVIDLHRDGIEPDPNLVTTVNGKPCAKIMFVNGVSALNENGSVSEVSSLPNENLQENLAFSFNMQIAANEIYPDFTRKIYLKPYRYSTHMRGKSLLVEVGSQYNTKEEVLNSMELLADLINSVVFS